MYGQMQQIQDRKFSKVWTYFNHIEKSKVACNLCEPYTKIFNVRSSSTTSLWNHLLRRHGIGKDMRITNLIKSSKSRKNSLGASSIRASTARRLPQPNIQTKIEQTWREDTNINEMMIDEINFTADDYEIWHLVAVQEIPIDIIEKSSFIHKAYQSFNLQMPVNINDYIEDQAKIYMNQIKKQIRRRLQINQRFGLVISQIQFSGKRFISFILSCCDRNQLPLGTYRLKQTTASSIDFIISKCLEQYAIDLRMDIISLTTSNKERFDHIGNQLNKYHHFCYISFLNCMTNNFLYHSGAKNQSNKESSEQPNNENRSYLNEQEQLTDSYLASGIFKIRKTILSIKRQSGQQVKQLIANIFKGKENLFKIDVRRNWQSLMAMIEQYLEWIEPNKTYLPFRIQILEFEELSRIKIVENILKNVKQATRSLQNLQNGFLDAKFVFKNLIQSLKKIQSQMSVQFAHQLFNQMNICYKGNVLVNLTQFLANPTMYNKLNGNSKQVKQLAWLIINQNYNCNSNSNQVRSKNISKERLTNYIEDYDVRGIKNSVIEFLERSMKSISPTTYNSRKELNNIRMIANRNLNKILDKTIWGISILRYKNTYVNGAL